MALTFGPPEQASVVPVDEIALVVNREAISRGQLQRELSAAQKELPKNADIPLPQEQDILMEYVIARHLIQQLLEKAALTLSEPEIDQAIVGIAQQNGVTAAELYARVARDTGMNVEAYRKNVAEQIVHSQLKQRTVGHDIRISQNEIDAQVTQISRERGATIHLQDLLVAIPDGTPEVRAAAYDEVIRKIAAALEEYNTDLAAVSRALPNTHFRDLGDVNIGQIPPRFSRAVANLSDGSVVSAPVIDSYGMHFLKVVSKTGGSGEGYRVTQAKLRHILIRNTPQNPAAAKFRIDTLAAQLKAGADFAELARRYSEDPASSIKGGALGWQSVDQVAPRFAEVMTGIPLNKISEPFQTAFGWHIIEVDARRTVDRSEEKIRERIRNMLYEAALEQSWQQKLAELRQAAYIDIR